MNLLDRYIFKSVLFACAAAVGLFAFIVIVPNVARDLLNHMLAGQLPALTAGKLILLLVPIALVYALPMGILTGVLLTLGRLSADSEVTAMRAAGLSLRRLARPILILAALSMGVALYFNFDSMPRARVAYESSFAAAIRTNPMNFIVPKTFVRDFPNIVVYVGEKQGSLLRDVWVWKLDASGREREGIHAQSGRIEYDSTANEFVLTPIGVTVEDRDEKAPEDFRQAPVVASSERFAPIRIPLSRFFGHQTGVHIKQEWLTYEELKQARAKAAATPTPTDPDQAKLARRDRMKLEMVYHDKINTALAVFSLALVGVPLGIKVSRRETSANFAVAVGLTLGYYLLTVSVKVLDRHPEYRPDLLLWAPNLLLIGVGIWLFARIERR